MPNIVPKTMEDWMRRRELSSQTVDDRKSDLVARNIADTVDLDDFLWSGRYFRESTTGTTTALGYPEDGAAGTLEVIRNPASVEAQQVFHNRVTGVSWIRWYDGVSWGPWMSGFGTNPAVLAQRTTNFGVADNATSTVPFGSEIFDTDNMHSTVTDNSRITFNTAGIYFIGFNGVFEAGNDYLRLRGWIRLNGSDLIVGSQNPGTGTNTFQTLDMQTLRQFSVGDYIEVRVLQDNTSGASRNLVAANDSPRFYAAKMG